jgi:hypothetical protein
MMRRFCEKRIRGLGRALFVQLSSAHSWYCPRVTLSLIAIAGTAASPNRVEVKARQ